MKSIAFDVFAENTSCVMFKSPKIISEQKKGVSCMEKDSCINKALEGLCCSPIITAVCSKMIGT